MIALAALLPLQVSLAAAQREAEYYAVDPLLAPEGEVLEVGGMGWLPDGRLALSTRRGEVWLVADALDADPAKARFHRFAEGLWEGLGLAVVEGQLYVLQRGEVSRLVDADGDDVCDRIESVSSGWGLSGHYHEFAYGLPYDERGGGFFVALNVSFGGTKWWLGESTVPWRGWVVRTRLDRDEVTPFASGFRSPCGLALSPDGDLFVSDNQGDWVASSPIHHVREGRFYGHPASLRWTEEYQASRTIPSDTVPPDRERTPPAVWLPYKWSRSTGAMIWDESAGAFGPFAGQMLVAELTNGLVLRVALEKVRGEWQGAAFLFRQRVGSGIRLAQASDGSLFVGRTNRGWGGLAPGSGLARIRWTGVTPFEMESVRLADDGFVVRFTEPLAEDASPSPADVALVRYHYDWHWEYGSPERGTAPLAVSDVTVAPDRRSLHLRVPDLAAGEVVRGVLSNLTGASGRALLHDEFAYTVNQLRTGPPAAMPVARLVPPPPARETQDEGWLRLCYGDAFDRWTSSGWELADVELDPQDPARVVATPGVGALLAGPEATPFASRQEFGDLRLECQFFLAEGGAGTVFLQGRYGLRLEANVPGEPLRCAAIDLAGADAPLAPQLDAWKGPGAWHELLVDFRAPRFDEEGRRVESARFERVLVDDVLMHEGVELPGPGPGGADGEVALGPLVFAPRGAIALGGIQVRPRFERSVEPCWVVALDEAMLGWNDVGDATWTFEDGVLRSGGGRGWLAKGVELGDFDVRCRIKVGDGGDAGLVLRSREVNGEVEGYEVQVNSSYPDPEHTGSLRGRAPIRAQLVPPDTWCDLVASVRDEGRGARVRVWVNGVLFVDHLDPDLTYDTGGIAIEQHHSGSVVEVEDLDVCPRRR